jgi:hypothetical protein
LQVQLNVEDQGKLKEKTGFTAGLSSAKGGYDYAKRKGGKGGVNSGKGGHDGA